MKQFWMYTGVGVIVILATLFHVNNVIAAEIVGKSTSIVLDQTNVTSPQVISVSIENNNPERYKTKLLDHYIVIKLEDIAGTVLFEGQVKNYKLDTVNTTNPPTYLEIPDNPLSINIPLFEEGRKVRLFDEAGTQLLEIDLGQYGIGATPTAAPRIATCNKCGYCKGNTKQPGDLQQCMKCLYPDYVDKIDDTLKVDPIKNQPVQPLTGRYYSQIGCIDVGIAGFRDPTAAGGVLNIILSRLLFPITGVLSILSLIYGSFLLITAQDNPEQIDRGKKWIYGAIVGVVFTFGAILLIRIIGGDILKIPGLDT